MYVRVVRRNFWKRLLAGAAGAVDGAADDLIRTGSMVSVFECHSTADIELVSVAYSARRRFETPFDYIELEDSLLEPYRILATPGDTPLPDANVLHRDLDLSGDGARMLAMKLRLSGFEMPRIRVPELRAIAVRLRDSGQPIPASSWLLDGS